MSKITAATLRTRHITCVYCMAICLLILAIILFALATQDPHTLGNNQTRTPVIIGATIILILAILISIWMTYYTMGYCRMKRSQQQQSKSKTNISTIVVFDNSAFTMDDPLTDDAGNVQTSA